MMGLEALFLALIITAPALYEAFILDERSVENALVRYVVVALACTAGLTVLRRMYVQFAATAPRRRFNDRTTSEGHSDGRTIVGRRGAPDRKGSSPVVTVADDHSASPLVDPLSDFPAARQAEGDRATGRRRASDPPGD